MAEEVEVEQLRQDVSKTAPDSIDGKTWNSIKNCYYRSS